jgi:hypothetical protein
MARQAGARLFSIGTPAAWSILRLVARPRRSQCRLVDQVQHARAVDEHDRPPARRGRAPERAAPADPQPVDSPVNAVRPVTTSPAINATHEAVAVFPSETSRTLSTPKAAALV